MSSSITEVSSTRVDTFLLERRSSIHLNRKIKPYTGLNTQHTYSVNISSTIYWCSVCVCVRAWLYTTSGIYSAGRRSPPPEHPSHLSNTQTTCRLHSVSLLHHFKSNHLPKKRAGTSAVQKRSSPKSSTSSVKRPENTQSTEEPHHCTSTLGVERCFLHDHQQESR